VDQETLKSSPPKNLAGMSAQHKTNTPIRTLLESCRVIEATLDLAIPRTTEIYSVSTVCLMRVLSCKLNTVITRSKALFASLDQMAVSLNDLSKFHN